MSKLDAVLQKYGYTDYPGNRTSAVRWARGIIADTGPMPEANRIKAREILAAADANEELPAAPTAPMAVIPFPAGPRVSEAGDGAETVVVLGVDAANTAVSVEDTLADAAAWARIVTLTPTGRRIREALAASGIYTSAPGGIVGSTMDPVCSEQELQALVTRDRAARGMAPIQFPDPRTAVARVMPPAPAGPTPAQVSQGEADFQALIARDREGAGMPVRRAQ